MRRCILTSVVPNGGLQLGALAEDITKRPFITVGFLALVLLIPLAVTSARGTVSGLGYQKWQRLHQLVYLAAALGYLFACGPCSFGKCCAIHS